MNKEVLQAKSDVVNEIVTRSQENATLVVVTYHGLSVAKLQELRRALRKEEAELCVYKNSLVERASEELGYKELVDILSGPNAIIFSKEVSNGAKVVAKYSRRFENLVIKGGVVDGQFANADKMKEVAKLPGREGLISMFLSCLQAPIRQFACAVQAVADK